MGWSVLADSVGPARPERSAPWATSTSVSRIGRRRAMRRRGAADEVGAMGRKTVTPQED